MGTILFTLLYLTVTQNLLISQQSAYVTNGNEAEISFNFGTLSLDIFKLVRKTAKNTY
jgi:hypothetical protein